VNVTQKMCALIHIGDAMDPESIEKAWEYCEAEVVVSTLGGSPADPAVDSVGNINLINSAIKHGAKRFVLVTSIGAGDSKDATPQQVCETYSPPFETLLGAMTDALAHGSWC